jgi:hypothetical protein
MNMITSQNMLDERIASRIRHNVVSRYLTQTGWECVFEKPEKIRVFSAIKAEKEYQVTIPLREELYDYGMLMVKAIQDIADYQQFSINSVATFLQNPTSDIVRIRLVSVNATEGVICLDDAVSLYENAKKLLTSVASEVSSPQKTFVGSYPKAVNEFINSCKFGQTEIGSYIIPVVCPFAVSNSPTEYEQISIFSENEKWENAFTRRITKKLLSNIITVKSAIDLSEEKKIIEDYDRHNISGNFLDSLANMDLQQESSELEFSLEWSPIVTSNRHTTSSVKISHDYYEPIRSLSKRYKQTNPSLRKIVGKITELSGDGDVDKRKNGKITVSYIENNEGKEKIKHAHAVLSLADYDIALQAHKNGDDVRLQGELNGNNLSKVEGFGIIE